MSESLSQPTKKEYDPQKDINSALNKFWQGERKEGDPDIKFEVVFSHHLGAKDFEPVKKQFSDADIYIPETFAWGRNSAQAYPALAHNLITPEKVEQAYAQVMPDHKKRINYPFLNAMRRTMHGSGKEIVIIDVPEKHEIENLSVQADNTFETMLRTKNFEEKIRIVKEYIKVRAYFELVRDKYMIQQLPKRIREVLDKNLGLRKKPEIKVLISLGLLHTPFYIQLKAFDDQKAVHRTFDSNPTIFGFAAEGERRLKFGQHIESLSEDFLSKVVFENEFWAHFERGIKEKAAEEPTYIISEKIRSVVKAFSLEDIKHLYDLVGRGKKFRDVTLEICKVKGIDMKGF